MRVMRVIRGITISGQVGDGLSEMWSRIWGGVQDFVQGWLQQGNLQGTPTFWHSLGQQSDEIFGVLQGLFGATGVPQTPTDIRTGCSLLGLEYDSATNSCRRPVVCALPYVKDPVTNTCILPEKKFPTWGWWAIGGGGGLLLLILIITLTKPKQLPPPTY